MVHVSLFRHDHTSYRRLVRLSYTTFLFGVTYGLFSFYLPIFTENAVGNVAVVGILLALAEIMGIIVDLPLGAFIDRYGRKRTMLWGSFLLLLSALLFQLSGSSLIALAVALSFYGIVVEFLLIPLDAELMAVSPRRRSGKFFGVYEAAHNFGYTVGPFIGGFLIWYSPPPVFWALSALVVLLFLFVSFFIDSPKRRRESVFHALALVFKKDHYLMSSIREFRLLGWEGRILLVFWFTFAFRWGAIAILEPLFMLDLGLHPVLIGIIYAASTLPFVFFSSPAGSLSDRFGAWPFIAGGLCLMGSATFLFGTFESALFLFLLAFVAAIGDAILVPTVLASFDTLSQRHFKGKISSVLAFTEDTGYFLGPLIAGPAAALWGFRVTFYGFGIFIIAVMVVAIATRGLNWNRSTV